MSDSTTEPTVSRWIVEPIDQGQIVEIAHGWDDSGDEWFRRTDQSFPVGHPERVEYSRDRADFGRV